MIEKNLFIRCSEETYKLAHALAKSESRSLNKQVIHMIHAESKLRNINLPKTKKVDSIGLKGLVQTRTPGASD